MPPLDIDTYASRSHALDLTGMAWDDVPGQPLSPDVLRTLRDMQDIEAHTSVYLRTLLSPRAMDHPERATFLACWFYEETFHGRALARFLAAAGHPVAPRPRSRESFFQWAEARATAVVARLWPDFVGVHMAWGAINELTTLIGYQRLSQVAGHPVLSELLARIMRDESRHFSFYYRQAERRLARPGTARVARFLVDRFWAPVGSRVQPDEEVRVLTRYLMTGEQGRLAARRVDALLRKLPSVATERLVQSSALPALVAWV